MTDKMLVLSWLTFCRSIDIGHVPRFIQWHKRYFIPRENQPISCRGGTKWKYIPISIDVLHKVENIYKTYDKIRQWYIKETNACWGENSHNTHIRDVRTVHDALKAINPFSTLMFFQSVGIIHKTQKFLLILSQHHMSNNCC